MNDLQKLKFRQARRAERPHTALKIFAGAILLFIGLGLVQNCGHVREQPATKAQKKKYVDALWAGTADANKYRLP